MLRVFDAVSGTMMWSLKKRVSSWVCCVTTLWLTIVLSATNPLASDSALPFDVAFSRRVLPADERATLSPDGRWFAYTTQTPPAYGKADSALLPSGAPGHSVGKTVFVGRVADGRSDRVGPKDGYCWRPSFSPDGTKIAAYCDSGGGPRLWIHDVARRSSRQLSDATIKAKVWEGDEPAWAPGGMEIFVPLVPQMGSSVQSAALAPTKIPNVDVQGAGAEWRPNQQDVGAQDQWLKYNNAALAAIHIQSGAVRSIVPAGADPSPSHLRLSPTGSWVAYISANGLECAVVPATGGPVRLVTSHLHRNRGSGFALTAWGWHPSRDQLFWVEEHRLWTLDLAARDTVPRQVASTLADITIGPVVFTPDGKHVVVGTLPVSIDDFHNPYPQALAVVSLDTGLTHVLKLPVGLYVQSPFLQERSTLWSPQGSAITILCHDLRTAERVVGRLDLDSGQLTTLWRGFASVQFAGASRDHQVAIGAFEDSHTPRNLYRFDAQFARQGKVTDVEPRLNTLRLGPVETFQTTMPAYDGGVISTTTTVLLPVGTKRGDRLPTLVFLYPGLNLSQGRAAEFGGGSPSSVPLALFTSRGYAVLLVDAPIGPMDVAGDPASELTDVVVSQVYRAAELGYTDTARVAVIGQSAGGYAAAATIMRTHLFRAAIAISGFYDLPGLYPTKALSVIHRRLGTHPWGDPQRYLSNSPYYRAGQIRTPILLLHGESDQGCPVEEARKLFAALELLGRSAQLATYRGAGHVVSEWPLASAVDAGRRMTEFLDRHLGLPATATASQ